MRPPPRVSGIRAPQGPRLHPRIMSTAPSSTPHRATPALPVKPAAAGPAHGHHLTLDQLATGVSATVTGLRAPEALPEWRRQLLDLGFVAGETVQVMRRAALGGDPLVVRVGASTYALRRAEAACVHLHATHTHPTHRHAS